MTNEYLLVAISYIHKTYGICLSKNSETLPEQVHLLMQKFNCPVLAELWGQFMEDLYPSWMQHAA
jgi:hypothetical protein